MNSNRLTYLFGRFVAGNCNEQELRELWHLVKEAPDGNPIRAALERIWHMDASPTKDEPDWNDLFTKIKSTAAVEELELQAKSKPVYRLRVFWPVTTAALVLIMVGIYYWNQPSTGTTAPSEIAAAISTESDVPAGGNRAILTLEDGSELVLNEHVKGELARQHDARIVQLDSKLEYQAAAKSTVAKHTIQQTTYNTLSTPRGGQFQLQLPDGTQVWLNAASSIRYPTTFAGKERRVSITGEVYFEVSQLKLPGANTNSKWPFVVTADNGTEVEVLGTHFNVNAYHDEPALKATLLEGAVNIKHQQKSLRLQPGQQAKVDAAMELIPNPNLVRTMAWKNGAFYFEGLSLKEVMRQLSRWYDIDVEFKEGVPDISFGGKIGRDVSLAKLLHFFKGSGVHFRIDNNGKKLVVLP